MTPRVQTQLTEEQVRATSKSAATLVARFETKGMKVYQDGDKITLARAYVALAGAYLAQRETLDTIRKRLAMFPAMNDGEAADAAGDIAAMFFSEQGNDGAT